MILRILGAALRAALVTMVISIPALLLPNISVAAQEITLIAAGLAAAFTLFEYASTHPGLIDFRFAPPYNRVRFVSFLVQILSLVFLCRATGGQLAPHPVECLDAGWFTEDDLPSPVANYDRWGRHAFAAIAGRDDSVVYDVPRSPVWRNPDGAG